MREEPDLLIELWITGRLWKTQDAAAGALAVGVLLELEELEPAELELEESEDDAVLDDDEARLSVR